MNVTQTDDMFDCDCGFSWRRGQSGYHHCEDGLRAKIAELKSRNSHLKAEHDRGFELRRNAEAQRDALLGAIRPFELAYMTWNGARAMNQFGTALTIEAFKQAAETVHKVKIGLPGHSDELLAALEEAHQAIANMPPPVFTDGSGKRHLVGDTVPVMNLLARLQSAITKAKGGAS